MTLLSKTAKDTRLWLGRHRPHMSKGLLLTEKMLGALEGIPGLDSIKIMNFGSSVLRGVIMKYHEKVSFFWALEKTISEDFMKPI